MAKRKRNQSSAATSGQSAAHSPSKKTKVDIGHIINAKSTQPPKSGKSAIASPKLERAPKETPQKSTEPQTVSTSGLSKAAEKRKRQKKHARKLRKQASAAIQSGGQEAQQGHSIEQTSQQASSGSAIGQNQKADARESKNDSKREAPVSKASSNQKASVEQTEKAKIRTPAREAKPKQPHKDAGHESKQPDVPKKTTHSRPEAPSDKAGVKLSKKQRRRQKLYQAKHGNTMPNSPSSRKAQRDDDRSIPSDISLSSKPKSDADESLLRKTTQTNLLPRPTKQWVDERQLDSNTSAHTRVTQTILMPRPTKEWVQQHAPPKVTPQTSHKAAKEADEASPGISNNPAKDASKPSLARDSPSSSAEHSTSDSPEEADRSLTKVGFPPGDQTSIERPPINTIASFSFSARRHHPAELLSGERRTSGLRGMRMDTGSVGSAPKPMNSLKATSVPSYSGRSDVKATFQRFQEFTRGGESSGSEEESDTSESESEDEGKPSATPKASSHVVESARSASFDQDESRVASDASLSDQIVPPAQTGTHELTGHQLRHDDMNANNATAGAGNSCADTTGQADKQHNTSSSADSSASEDESMEDAEQSNNKVLQQETLSSQAETPQTPADDLTDEAEMGAEKSEMAPPSKQPSMQTSKDLPLFSDFNARHSSENADPALKRSNSFLGSDLGGSLSGTGPIDDHLMQATNNHLESQDLFKSIDDFSREVFGSIREVHDCKPISIPLDNTPEPLVTDSLSDHGLNQKTGEQKTPDNATALENIIRGSSPMVYIVNGVDALHGAMLNVDEDAESDNEEHGAGSRPLPAIQKAGSDRYSSPPSSLSSLTPSPPPPPDEASRSDSASADHEDDQVDCIEQLGESSRPDNTIALKKRKMTGATSKHFSPQKTLPKKSQISGSEDATKAASLEEDHPKLEPTDDSDVQLKPTNSKKKKNTGKTSEFFTPSPTKTPRPPKGTSTCPVPPTTSAHFGLIQEKLWREPFWLIIAVTLLNKTAGRSAAPVFWSLKELYPTPEDLAKADVNHLISMIETLGLQNQRANRFILIAKAWLENPPEKEKRYRTLHYPAKNDGKDIKKGAVVETDSDDCAGALEIGHIPGCGPYAWDSWRIFCRDVVRGLATDYNGEGAAVAGIEDFVPEWQRVLPLDKELRACLRWMWLREGWIWDCGTGNRRVASEEEMARGRVGEMEIGDEQERKFARGAAEAEAGEGVESDEAGLEGKGVEDDGKRDFNEEAVSAKKGKGSRKMSVARRELDVESGEEPVVVPRRRSRRNKPAK